MENYYYCCSGVCVELRTVYLFILSAIFRFSFCALNLIFGQPLFMLCMISAAKGKHFQNSTRTNTRINFISRQRSPSPDSAGYIYSKWSHISKLVLSEPSECKLFSVGHARTHRTARYAASRLRLAFENCVCT